MNKVYCDNYLIFDTHLPELKIINPKLQLELNKTGSFTFTIYPTHPHYSRLQKLKSIITVYQDEDMIFRGRMTSDEQGWNNEKQVTCEGELAFLVDSVQRPYDFMSGTLHTTVADLFTFFITNHNTQVDEAHRFIVGNITVTDPNNYIVRSDSTYLNTWNSINKKLIESYGGYLWVRHEADGNYIDYLADFDTINQQAVEFGKNLLDISKQTKGENTITALIPLGKKIENSDARLTIESIPDTSDDSSDIQKHGDYVYSRSGVTQYGWIIGTSTWDDVTTANALVQKGSELLSTSMNLSVSIDLTAADLAAADSSVTAFHIGSYIRAYTQPHGVNANFLVTKLTLNLLNPESNKLTLGIKYSTFTEQTSGATQNYNKVVEQVNNAENQIGRIQGDIQSQLDSIVSQMPDEIMSSVAENYYTKDEANTLVQTVDTKFTQTDAQFQEINNYIRFVDGNVVLGEEENELTLKIQNDALEIALDVDITGTLIQDERKTATLLNNWVNYGAEYESATYWKDSCGVVHMAGLIKSGATTAETVIFNLPAGYRPRISEKFFAVSLNTICVLDVYATGNVAIKTGANADWLSLSGISFRATD